MSEQHCNLWRDSEPKWWNFNLVWWSQMQSVKYLLLVWNHPAVDRLLHWFLHICCDFNARVHVEVPEMSTVCTILWGLGSEVCKQFETKLHISQECQIDWIFWSDMRPMLKVQAGLNSRLPHFMLPSLNASLHFKLQRSLQNSYFWFWTTLLWMNSCILFIRCDLTLKIGRDADSLQNCLSEDGFPCPSQNYEV